MLHRHSFSKMKHILDTVACKCDSSNISNMHLEVILQISITKCRVDSDVHVNSVTQMLLCWRHRYTHLQTDSLKQGTFHYYFSLSDESENVLGSIQVMLSVNIKSESCLRCWTFLERISGFYAFKVTVWIGSASKTLSNMPLIQSLPSTQRRHVYVQSAE